MTKSRPVTAGPPARNLPSRALVLSVVVPVYNERFLVRELLERVLAVEIDGIRDLEVVVVDDGSTDGTREILEELARDEPRMRLFFQDENRGKGAAVRRGIDEATGDLVVIQDADLEYDPRDYARLVRPFLEDGADVVYGSRFLTGERRRVLYFRHTLGNRLITLLSNLFTDLNLTDVETCYKMFRAPLLKSIPIRSDDFAMEPEITAKVAKRRFRIFEVPISYVGRTYREGKKIGVRDLFKALYTIVKYWVVDDLYAEDEYGSHILHDLEHAHRFNRWMADSIAEDLGERVLEIGAGIGNITHWLLPRERYVASDVNPHFAHYLENFASGKPYLEVAKIDLEDPGDFEPWNEAFDTVVCLNVLEHVSDPDRAVRNMASALEAGGRLVVYVPRGPRLTSRLDEVLGHRCRYRARELRDQLEGAGFEIESMRHFNRAGVLAWWWNGKLLRRSGFGRFQLKLYDWSVPLFSRIDHLLPWPGLGLLAVARKPSSSVDSGARST
ncbi:MAG: glycosyltransferase [Thermoanaerobaculia bacterium]|nr:glycosyltransferase [Thermoanaerobaculia bacterium]